MLDLTITYIMHTSRVNGFVRSCFLVLFIHAAKRLYCNVKRREMWCESTDLGLRRSDDLLFVDTDRSGGVVIVTAWWLGASYSCSGLLSSRVRMAVDGTPIY